MFNSYDFDVHAVKHQGESKNFILDKCLSRQNDDNDKGIIYQSSNHFNVQSEYFGDCCDKCDVLKKPKLNQKALQKSVELKNRIKSFSNKSNEQSSQILYKGMGEYVNVFN